MVDVVVKEEDAPRINRIVERFKFASVTEAAQIKTEIEKSREEKSHRKSRETSPVKAGPDTGKPKQKEEPPQDQKAMSGKSPAAPAAGTPGKVTGGPASWTNCFGGTGKERGETAKPLFGKDREIPSVRAYLREARQNRRGYF